VLEIDDGKSYKSLEEKEIRLTAIWKAFDNKATSTEDLFIKAVKKFSAVQRDKVKDVIKKATTEDALMKAINGQFTNATHNAVKSSLAPAWIESLKAGRDHALDVMGGKAYHAKSKTSDVTNVWFNKWIETAGLKKAKQIDDTTQEELIRTLVPTLVNSIESGDGMNAKIDALMKVADDVYFKLDESRAQMIARTETTSAVNAGSFALYSSEGVTKKTWLSVRDDRTRSIDDGAEFDHDGADGQTVDIDKKFIIHGTNGDEELDFPGDSEGSAGNVCNCRCTFIPEGIGE